MTLKEMSQLYHLNREIESLQSQLEALECEAEKITQTLSDSPRAPGVSDKTGKYAVLIADLRDKIKNRKARCWDELARLNEYIDNIDDSLTRQVIHLRFVNGLSWQQVAAETGSSEYAVKQMCYRYLNSH
ncbi:MAG: hypothetical protein IJF40_04630 [Clostridia bacterium]|nr:hypothetical protein [Clostridia bacterium]